MSDWSLPVAAVSQPALEKDTDIHGTGELPRVVGVGRPEEAIPVPMPSGYLPYSVAVVLNFVPTDAQLETLREHLRSWHP